MQKSLIFNILKLFVALLPLTLISGPAIPDVTISLSALFFLVFIIIEKNKKYFTHPIYNFLIFFSIYLIVRSLFSHYPIYSLTEEGSMFYFRYIFFSMFLIFLFENFSNFLNTTFYIMIFCIFILFIDTIYQFYFGYNILGIEPYSETRMTSFMGDEAILGRYISYISPISLILLLLIKVNHKFKFILTLLITSFSFILVILSGDRVPSLIFFIFSIVFLGIYFRNRLKVLIIFYSFLILVFVSMLNFSSIKTRFIVNTFDDMKDTKFKALPISSHYEEHYHSAFKMGYENFLFGKGTNLFDRYCNDEKYQISETSCSSHPHNFYLQLWAENGTFGLFLLVFFYSFLFSKMSILILKIKKQNNIFNNEIFFAKFSCLLLLLLFLLPIIPHLSFYNNWNNILLYYILSLYLYLDRKFL